MYVIAAIIILGYGILWWLARKEAVVGKGFTPTLRMAAWIYKRMLWMQEEDGGGQRISLKLQKLYPGEDRSLILTRYYVEKTSLVLVVILAGTVLGTAMSLQEDGERSLQTGNVIERGDYREEGKELELEAHVSGYPEQVFQITVAGKVPDKTQADALEEEFWEKMQAAALNNNRSWNQVCEELLLEETLEGYPFTVEWTSESPHIVDDEGNVKRLLRGEEEKVMLTAVVSYHEWEWQHALELTVKSAVTDEEEMYLELEQALDGWEQETREEVLVTLPSVWQGKEIRWSERVENYGLTLWMLAVAAGVLIFFLKDRDLEAQVEIRQRQLRESYPVIIHKLTLYLGAGLTIRGAFMRIADAYLAGASQRKEAIAVYEEMLHTCRELRIGMAETEAYERFGIRCGLQEYVRLGALLSQNVVKGSSGLINRLTEESETAVKEQLQRSRQLGEEASTKLLVPMVMMLGIVMVMIMIPAFGTF